MRTRKGYLVKRGSTYYAVWYVRKPTKNADGTSQFKKFMQTTGCTDERKAQKELARIMQPHLLENDKRHLQTVKSWIESTDSELAVLNDERNPPLTITRAWDAFLESPTRRDTGPSTLAQYAFQFTRFEKWMASEHPGAKYLQDVTPDIAAQFAFSLTKEKRSANTFNKYMNVLSLVFSTVSDKARLKVNPWLNPRKEGAGKGIGRKDLISHSRRELTLEELKDVCERAEGEMRMLLAIGIYTGLRLGDAATLRWGEVDVIRGVILRIPNKTGRKSPKAVHIPIHPALKAMLTEIPSRARGMYVMPRMAEDYLSRVDAVTDQVQKLFSDCGIVTHKPGTGIELKADPDGKVKRVKTGKRAVIEVGFHSLRHTFVSLCRAANTPLSVVESIVGHSNPAMTRHYTHTGEAAAMAAISALPSMDRVEVKALPPAGSGRMVDLEAVHTIAKAMTETNWTAKRDELLALGTKEAI
jgi:integrase